MWSEREGGGGGFSNPLLHLFGEKVELSWSKLFTELYIGNNAKEGDNQYLLRVSSILILARPPKLNLDLG